MNATVMTTGLGVIIATATASKTDARGSGSILCLS
jgi:hypothetical protein